MATVKGSVRSRGAAVDGLRIVAFEESRAEGDRDRPGRLTSPVLRRLGDAVLGPDGTFTVDYEEPARSTMKRSVFVQVFRGSELLSVSARKIGLPDLGFDLDFGRDFVFDPGRPKPIAVGTVTRCGQPAAGLTVVAMESVTQGAPFGSIPCLPGSPVLRIIGTDEVDAEGGFRFSLDPTEEPADACFFRQRVFLRVFDDSTLLGETTQKQITGAVRFDHELLQGCAAGTTLVQVMSGGVPVRGAEVFRNGELVDVTNTLGFLTIEGAAVGDQLAARVRLLENETPRGSHSRDSNQDWNFRLYQTSIAVVHDANGDQVALPLQEITDPAEVQTLRLSPSNGLVALNLVVSVEWDASSDELLYYRDRLLETSELMFNATDGQFLIERIDIVDSARLWDRADARIYASLSQSSNAKLSGILGKSGRIKMNPFDSFFPGTWLHELGHYVWGLRDEYKKGAGWDEANGPTRCTLQSTDSGTPFSENGSKDACVMRGARFGSRKKICCSLPTNPHVDGTKQGAVDCWTTLMSTFGANVGWRRPNWRLQGPVNRGTIVGRLPDSGLSLGTGSSPPAAADVADSYIPVTAWKPRWHIGHSVVPNLCPGQIVRVVQGGEPQGGMAVLLRTQDGRSIYQGMTGSTPRNLSDGTTLAPGEISLRGAHVGDTVEARKLFIPTAGFLTLGPCSSQTQDLELAPSPFVFSLSSTISDDGSLALSVETNGTVHSPPTIDVGAEGEEELRRIHLDRASDSAYRGAIHALGDQDEVTLDVVAFDSKGEQGVLRTTASIAVARGRESVHLLSVDGQLEIELPPGAPDIDGRLCIAEPFGVLPLAEGDETIAGPFEVSSSWGPDLPRPALLDVDIAHQTRGGYGSENLVLLRLDAGGKEWYEVPGEARDEPLGYSATISQLGTFILVSRRLD